MRRFLLLICLLSAARSAAGADPVEAPTPLEGIVRRHAERFVAGKTGRTVVVGVTTPAGRRVWGFGAYERDGMRVVPDGRTIYEIGSVTKTFTGTLLADAVLRGEVALDAPIRTKLPADWSVPTRDGREITFLHLAAHTSSLPRMPPGFGPFLLLTGTTDDPYSEYADENLKLSLSHIELNRPIGSRHEYSNLAMGLLGVTLAKAAGAGDVGDHFRTRILDPLALRDTGFTLAADQVRRLAAPLKANGDPAHVWNFDSLKACGGLRSTADDLLTYAEAAIGTKETPLGPAFEFARRPWRELASENRFIGLGWFVHPMPVPGKKGVSTPLVWHNGATGGYRSFLGTLPERKSAVVILSNSTEAVDPVLSQPILRHLTRE